MNAKDLKVGNILVRDCMYWGISNGDRNGFFQDRYGFYRITQATHKTVYLDHLEVEYKTVLMENCPEDDPIYEIDVEEVLDRVMGSFAVLKRIACTEYEIYDPNKSFRLN